MSSKGKFVPVMLTPFEENGAIDYDALARLTDYYLQAGATGLFANCLSSEMFELTAAERIAVTAFVVKQVAGAVPVFSTGTFGGPLAAQAEFSRRIYDAGASAVVAISSILVEEEETDEVFLERTQELFRLTGDIPFGFYECPVPYKRLLSAPLLKKIVDTGRVVYYKDTSLDIHSIEEKVAATTGYPGFELYDAYMVNAVASLQAGCSGLSCIQGNFVPELITWITQHFSDPSLTRETAIAQQFLTDSMDVMHDVYPVAAKYFLRSRGFSIGLTTRRNVGELSPLILEKLSKLSLDYDHLQEQLGFRKSVYSEASA